METNRLLTDAAHDILFSVVNTIAADKHWDGKLAFSKATSLYSKKDKNFAHFRRVK